MKNWSDVSKKYKDYELMKEFKKFWYNNKRNCYYLYIQEIKDIWGYLICFAETKGIEIFAPDCQIWDTKKENYILLAEHGECGDGKQMGYEQAMLWCATKFFEINEKVENETK